MLGLGKCGMTSWRGAADNTGVAVHLSLVLAVGVR